MDRTSPAEPAHVPFALYHGSSSHYLANFRPGETLLAWPHTRDALELYHRLWTELKRLGQSPDWWKKKYWLRTQAMRIGSTANSM